VGSASPRRAALKTLRQDIGGAASSTGQYGSFQGHYATGDFGVPYRASFRTTCSAAIPYSEFDAVYDFVISVEIEPFDARNNPAVAHVHDVHVFVAVRNAINSGCGTLDAGKHLVPSAHVPTTVMVSGDANRAKSASSAFEKSSSLL